MNWKTTAVFGGLLVLAGVVYLLYQPAGVVPRVETGLVSLRPDLVDRIELARPGEAPVALERVSAAPVPAWRVLPLDRPADPVAVQSMLQGLGRITATGSMEPGRPETDPKVTGLEPPRLTVAFQGEGRREAVRFGLPPPTNMSAVFCQREGDPRICLAESGVFDAYNRTAAQLRSRKLAEFDPHRIVRLEVDDRFLRPLGGGRMEAEYEKSLIQREEKGADRGWHLRKPWEERLDDMKVNQFLSDLSGLAAEEFQPAGDLKAKDLDPPQLVAAVTAHGAEKPCVVQFGGPARGAGKKDCLYAHVPGSGEVALVDRDAFDRLPRHRGQFRSDVIFPFLPADMKAIEVEAAGLGKMVLEQREVRKKVGEEELVTPVWEVLEPGDVEVERDRVDRFVMNLFIHRIQKFLGEQPDLKLFNLEPPEIALTVRAKDGRAVLLHFGMKGEEPGYMRREGRGEVIEVRPELVKLLRRLELNFRAFEMYNVPREDLREFRFEAKAKVPPVYYALRRDPADGRWKFSDKGHEKEEPDADRVDGLLAGLNYIKADVFVTRDPAAAARHRLRDGEAAHTLRIFAEKGPAEGVVLYISADLSEKVERRRYFARFGHGPVIFELNAGFVEALLREPVRKRE